MVVVGGEGGVWEDFLLFFRVLFDFDVVDVLVCIVGVIWEFWDRDLVEVDFVSVVCEEVDFKCLF